MSMYITLRFRIVKIGRRSIRQNPRLYGFREFSTVIATQRIEKRKWEGEGREREGKERAGAGRDLAVNSPNLVAIFRYLLVIGGSGASFSGNTPYESIISPGPSR